MLWWNPHMNNLHINSKTIYLPHACADPNTCHTQQLLLIQLLAIEWHDQSMPDCMDFHLNKCMTNTNLSKC